MCMPSIPKPQPSPPPPPAPVKMAEALKPSASTMAKRKPGGYGLDLLTIPMSPNVNGGAGANIPGAY